MSRLLCIAALLAASACGYNETTCDVVNSGWNYGYAISLLDGSEFVVYPEAAELFADDAAYALSCGAELTDDWEIEEIRPGTWLSYTHFDPGDILLSVNGETGTEEMLEQVERSAEAGLFMTIEYERRGVELVEDVHWVIER